MAWTQEELNTIEQAYKSGVKKVKFKDRETEFRDLSEMQKIIREARAELNGATRKPYAYASYNRGYQ
jgi:hypothetical protein